jgi:hypothetical protein
MVRNLAPLACWHFLLGFLAAIAAALVATARWRYLERDIG